MQMTTENLLYDLPMSPREITNRARNEVAESKPLRSKQSLAQIVSKVLNEQIHSEIEAGNLAPVSTKASTIQKLHPTSNSEVNKMVDES